MDVPRTTHTLLVCPSPHCVFVDDWFLSYTVCLRCAFFFHAFSKLHSSMTAGMVRGGRGRNGKAWIHFQHSNRNTTGTKKKRYRMLASQELNRMNALLFFAAITHLLHSTLIFEIYARIIISSQILFELWWPLPIDHNRRSISTYILCMYILLY